MLDRESNSIAKQEREDTRFTSIAIFVVSCSSIHKYALKSSSLLWKKYSQIIQTGIQFLLPVTAAVVVIVVIVVVVVVVVALMSTLVVSLVFVTVFDAKIYGVKLN